MHKFTALQLCVDSCSLSFAVHGRDSSSNANNIEIYISSERPKYMDIRATGRGTGLVHPVDAHVGFKMRELRVLNGISQEIVAEKLAVSFQQIQKYETGRNRISASRLYELAVIFGVSVSHFYEGIANNVNSAVFDAVGVEHTNVQANDNISSPNLDQLTDRQTLILMQQFSEIKSHNVKRRITELVKGLANPDVEETTEEQAA